MVLQLTAIGTYLAYLPAPDAVENFNNKIALIKEGTDKALQYSQDIENKFKHWLELVCEVHEVAVAKEERTSVDQKESSIKLQGLSVDAELWEMSLKEAQDAAKTMEENMDSKKKMFEKAADEIPIREYTTLVLM
jgi:hypothetical protein